MPAVWDARAPTTHARTQQLAAKAVGSKSSWQQKQQQLAAVVGRAGAEGQLGSSSWQH
jgi:hypothetical protein